MCHVLMINFLMIMEKAVCTLGLITLQDMKIKSNNYHLFVCRSFDKHFGFIFVATSKLDRKIQYHQNRTFLFFCLSIHKIRLMAQNTYFSFILTEGVYIYMWHDDCLWCVDYNAGFRSQI